MASVLVLVEHDEGNLKKVTAQMLTKARELGEPAAVFVGDGLEAATEALGRYGAGTVYAATGEGWTNQLTLPVVDALEAGRAGGGVRRRRARGGHRGPGPLRGRDRLRGHRGGLDQPAHPAGGRRAGGGRRPRRAGRGAGGGDRRGQGRRRAPGRPQGLGRAGRRGRPRRRPGGHAARLRRRNHRPLQGHRRHAGAGGQAQRLPGGGVAHRATGRRPGADAPGGPRRGPHDRARGGGARWPARRGRGRDHRLRGPRAPGPVQLRAGGGAGRRARRGRRRQPRRGGRRMVPAPAPGGADRQDGFTTALRGSWYLRCDPAPCGYADLEDDRRDQQGRRGTDLHHLGLWRGRGPLQGRPPADRGSREAKGLMRPPLPSAEPGRAKRGLTRRLERRSRTRGARRHRFLSPEGMQARHRYMTGVPAIMEAAHLLRSLGMAAWLLLTQPGRWLRLRVALRRLGAIVAEHAAEPSRPLPLERLLARRAEAERRLAATAPPWPSAEIDLVERARGFLRGGLLRYAGPRQLARWRLRAVERPLGPIVRALAAPPDPRLPAWRRFLRPVAGALTLTLLAGALAGLPAAAMLGGSVKAASAGLPDLANLQPLSQPERTQVYDRDGHLIEVLHDEQDRIVVPLTSMPQVLRDAVLAAEDERFYQHHGIDDRGILRALLANLIQGQTVQGSSTITQQLVRNAYPDLRDRSLVRKVKEASLAAQLEERMSKDQILEAYLNRVYFGAGYYGVEAASRGYFGRHVRDLSLAQAATLAGVIREPELSNPRSAPRRALQRRNTVLQQMGALAMVPPAEAARAARSRLGVRPPRQVGGQYPWFIDALKRQLLDDPRLGHSVAERRRRLYEGGLRIDTTLDPAAQHQAEQAVARWRPASGPDVALVAVDPRDGAVRAVVGGRDFRRHQFNLAVQGERQAGSAFKPFVLAAALDNGISPDSRWESGGLSGQICGSPWTVSNYEGKGSGRMSLREATWHSVNGVYARVMARLCPARVVSMAERLGLGVPERQSHAPSIALGAANVSPLGMASAYATLADQGVHQRPVLFTKVSRHGRTLFENRPEPERRISAALAYQVTDVLKGVVQHGTGTAAAIGRPVAGKTGTTQDYRDAWFVGYTPQLATAVWMGYPGREVPMLDVGGIRVTGGSYPARIWHDFMAAAMAGQPSLDWQRPPGTLGFTVLPPVSQQPRDQGTRPRKHGHGRG